MAQVMDLPHLTPKMRRVLELLLAGKSNPEIGKVMGIREGTVKQYLTLATLNCVPHVHNNPHLDPRVVLAVWVHERRSALGIRCDCDIDLSEVLYGV